MRLDNSYYQHKMGLLDDAAWDLTVERIRQIRNQWIGLELANSVTPEFRDEVERILEDG